jgi:hypothetical protein
MHNARFRLMAGLAGATLCLFAATSYGQNTSTQTGTTDGTAAPSASAQAPATTPDASAQSPATTGTITTGTETRTTATDQTTTTTGFPGGVLGILAVAVLVLLILFALFRGRDRTEVRETNTVASSASTPGARTTAGTAGGERMNLDSRAASGTTSTTSGINDPNARR